MTSGDYRESGYGLDLDLPTILYKLLVSCRRRRGLVRNSNHLRPPMYLSSMGSTVNI